MNDAVELVLKEIEVNYPNVKVPFHSRWRHFEFGRHNLCSELMERLPKVSKVENARRRFDLAIVSVLLDAGAGPDWRYNDKKTGIVHGRSEGLALASIGKAEESRAEIPSRWRAAAARAAAGPGSPAGCRRGGGRCAVAQAACTSVDP